MVVEALSQLTWILAQGQALPSCAMLSTTSNLFLHFPIWKMEIFIVTTSALPGQPKDTQGQEQESGRTRDHSLVQALSAESESAR